MRRLMILALILLATTATAQITGSIAAGGQTADTPGGESRFRELNGGERGGFFVDKLEIFGNGATRFDLQSRFSTGNSGFLDMTIDNAGWSGGFRFSRSRAWSGISFADDVLPGGASVESLYPYTTRLDSLFAEDDPYVDHTRAEGFVTRRIGSSTAVTFRGGLRQRDGVRVPNVGGFAFSDVGTAAFFTPGLQDVDSASTWGALEARTSIGRLALNVEAGTMNRENRTDYTMPAYGANALVDLNHWNEQTDAATRWLRASGVYMRERFSIEGGVSQFTTDADVEGRDFRTNRDGLRLERGTVDATVTSGGIGTTVRLGAPASLALSVDMQSRESDGNGNLFLRTSSVGGALAELSSDRVGATADFRMRLGGSTRMRLRSRVSTTESDLAESIAAYAQDLTRETDRAEVRGEVSTRFTKRARGRVWARLGREEQRVDLRQLDNGFTVGDLDRSDTGGGLELSFGGGAASTLLSFAAARTDFEREVPLFDPVFDPSSVLDVSDGQVTTLRATASSVWSLTRGSVWGEVGWLSTEYRFDDALAQPGFAFFDESVQGAVVALGSEFRPRESLRLTGNVEWVRDSDDLDRTLTRGSLEVGQTLRNDVEIFGRWTTGDLDAPRAFTDEFNADLFAIGVRTKF